MDGKIIVKKNGRIVIPKKIRNQLNIQEGTVLTVNVENFIAGGTITLKVVAK